MYINRDAPESGIASLLALQGTKGDTELVHMTKPEVKLLANTGLMSMNRETGLPRFADGGNILQSLIPMVAAIAFPALLGPSIAQTLGTSALVGNAIAGGLGTTVGGLIGGDDLDTALMKGLTSGGIQYGAGHFFPETFGYDDISSKKIPDTTEFLEASNLTEGIDYGNVGSYGIDSGESGPMASFLPVGNQPSDITSLHRPLQKMDIDPSWTYGNVDLQTGTGYNTFKGAAPEVPAEMIGKLYGAPESGIAKIPHGVPIRRWKDAPNLFADTSYDEHFITPPWRDWTADHWQGATPHADSYRSPIKQLTSAEDIGEAVVDNTRTGAVTETSWMDKFKDELPQSFDEFGERVWNPRTMASALGGVGANLLIPPDPEEVPRPKGPDPYVLRKRDYKYKRKDPSWMEGLTTEEILEAYEQGGIDRRFYEEPSHGEGVFPLVDAQSGGGIEDLIKMSETVGVQETPFEGKIPGQGHGMQDNVVMPILQRGGIAAVSPDEYVVPADVMAMIGNGSADAGAEQMDDFIADFRTVKYGRPEQPPQINGRGALQSLMK